jgi:hypothetical protein
MTKVEFPLRDSPQTNEGAFVNVLKVKIRTVLKNTIGLVDGTSNAYLYSKLGIELDSLRRRLDGDRSERLQRALLEPTAIPYWETGSQRMRHARSHSGKL